VCYGVLQGVLQCATVCCSACCNVLRCVAGRVAVCYSVLQCVLQCAAVRVAVCYSVLTFVDRACSSVLFAHSCCSMLQLRVHPLPMTRCTRGNIKCIEICGGLQDI